MASSTPEHVSVVIADDNPALQGLLEALLGFHPAVRVVAVCSDGATALERVFAEDADVALLDDEMPRMDGLRAAHVLRTCVPNTEPIVFSAMPETFAAEAAAIGVRVVSKLDSHDLVHRILEAGAEAQTRSTEPVKARVATRVLSRLRETLPTES
jgi:CheY-like chemotaxis protein